MMKEYTFEPIKGYPMLHWKSKRPFTSTQYYPAQLKEQYGEETDDWFNKIYWGDNLPVMSHLLKEYRGQCNLIYIDPPYDSKAEYKKIISLRDQQISNNLNSFEEKQYNDIWINDDYLQFMYERFILMRELLAENGSIYLHCDWHKIHHLRCIMDEVFGSNNFQNQITWKRTDSHNNVRRKFGQVSDILLYYVKSSDYTFNIDDVRTDLSEAALKGYSLYMLDDGTVVNYKEGLKNGRRFKLNDATVPSSNKDKQFTWRGARPSSGRSWPDNLEGMEAGLKSGKYYLRNPERGSAGCKVSFLDENKGQILQDIWMDCGTMKGGSSYPTQKPEELLERIIKASSNPGDIVFDCFMGSGTAQAAAMKLGRKFIGVDINLAAVQITTKRLIQIADNIKEKSLSSGVKSQQTEPHFYPGFQVLNVNQYDLFRNPAEAKDLLMQALEIQPLSSNILYDGEKDGRMVKIMPINRITSRVDLNALITGFDYKVFDKRNSENPGKPVEHLLLVCMGHEPNLAAALQSQMPNYKLDIEVVDILRDKAHLEFKRDSKAQIFIKNGELRIEQFYPMNLLQKLSLREENVENWKELTESIMIDFNFDGVVFEPQVVDVPPKNQLVQGFYEVPQNSGNIKVKITDLLSESLEVELKTK